MDWTPTKPKPSCVALQNDDDDEDAVVITALSAAPFCCHADLLIMTRPQLVETAQALNAKLPKALHIDISDARADTFIRHSIELLVGIRNDVPRAPKRNRSLSLNASDYDASFEENTADTLLPPSPASPLASRTTPNVSASVANRSVLASLREESDDEDREADRPSKRRRMDDTSPDCTPTRSLLSKSRPYTRRSEPLSIQSPAVGNANRLNRSQSHRLPERERGFPGLHRNITISRPGKRLRSQSAVLTSTPKVRRWVPKGTRTSGATGDETAGNDDFSSPSSGISAATTVSEDTQERVERVSGWLESSVAQEEVQGVATKLGAMSLGSPMSGSCSDMDISF